MQAEDALVSVSKLWSMASGFCAWFKFHNNRPSQMKS